MMILGNRTFKMAVSSAAVQKRSKLTKGTLLRRIPNNSSTPTGYLPIKKDKMNVKNSKMERIMIIIFPEMVLFSISGMEPDSNEL